MKAVKIDERWFRGVVGLVETESGLLPARFSESQLGHFAGVPGWRLRSRCPASVSIDFVTDAAEVALAFRLGGSTRNRTRLDVEVDGVIEHSFARDPIDPNWRELRFNLSPGAAGAAGAPGAREHHVRIYLPHDAECTITSLSIDEGATAQPVSDGGADSHGSIRPRILCFGDSITQGMDSLYPASVYPTVLARVLGAEVLNQGVGGHVFEASSLDPMLPFAPDLITVAYGTNDWARHNSMTSLGSAVSAYLARLNASFPGVSVLLVTPLWRADADKPRAAGTFADLAATIRSCASPYPHIHPVGGRTLVPNLPDYFVPDGVHPNSFGMVTLAAGLAREARKLLQVGRAADAV